MHQRREGCSIHALLCFFTLFVVFLLRFVFSVLLSVCFTLHTRQGGDTDAERGETQVCISHSQSMLHAHHHIDRLPLCDARSLSSHFVDYVNHGQPKLALFLYQKLHQNDLPYLNRHALVSLLKTCTALNDLDTGRALHSEIARLPVLERDAFLGSSLLNLYAKCGSLAHANEVFDRIPILCRDVVLWTALMANYVEQGQVNDALACVEKMKHEGISPNVYTLTCSLKASGSLGSPHKIEEIHADIVRKGWETELLISSTLVDMYAKCSELATARKLLDKLPCRTRFSWTAIITRYAEQGLGEHALTCFEDMQGNGVSPDAITYVCVLKACGSIGAKAKGHALHTEIVEKGFEKELLIGSTLVDMYAKSGSLQEACEVFRKFQPRDVVMWNALIAGFTEEGLPEEALHLFAQMQHEGISPDAVTFVFSLKACGIKQMQVKGRELHIAVVNKGLEGELLVGSTLVDTYCKLGSLTEAQMVFDKLYVRNVVSWTTLVTGYIEHGCSEGAFDCCKQMQDDGILSNNFTFVCSLKACGSIGATSKGRELHLEITQRGLDQELCIGNALVDMYSKCGSFETSNEVFNNLPIRDVVSWNVHMAAYAQLGECEEVFSSFNRMLAKGLKPDMVTLGCVLKACSHAGVVETGLAYFDLFRNKYSLTLTLEHYTSIIDLLGRAGHVDMTVGLVSKMPLHPGKLIWHCLLGTCQKWRNVELGWAAFEDAVQLDEADTSTYICMYNICTGDEINSR